MPEHLTAAEQEIERKAIQTAVEWRDTLCPKNLLDPLNGALHPITIAKIQGYITANGDDVSFAGLDRAVLATWDQLIWFGNMPPKPGPKRTPVPPPKYDPPLRPCDARKVNREFHENREKLRQDARKKSDDALKKQRKAAEDKRPGAIYFPEGHRMSGKINWAETKRVQDAFDLAHGIFNF